ncbi:MAG: hypothetical protein BroJett018_40230 [Chloroflexota bacterium]|nr:MAG: hypothetical protein BroJett018_40230 [Chloroflexota bacterium]
MTDSDYLEIRKNIAANVDAIIDTERRYMTVLTDMVLKAAPQIVADFDRAIELLPFWINYQPRQRGRAYSGTSIPWSEVAETAIGSNIIRAISVSDLQVKFPGLPSGADIRFATHDALIHFDVKVAGPNDRADEVVASPNQVSGDGVSWNEGVMNSSVMVQGQRAIMQFQPELAPFYVLEGKVLLCLTYFLKGVYVVERLGYQPISYFELVCVPNGLLLFDGPLYANTPGLLIPGKDEKTFVKKRTRIRLAPLADIANWRRALIWQRTP